VEQCCIGKKAEQELTLTADFLKLIAEKNRLKIVCLLAQGELCVCEIWEMLNISQNLTSHHLKALKDYGLISSRKEGLNVFYSLNTSSLEESKKLLNKFLNLRNKTNSIQFHKQN